MMRFQKALQLDFRLQQRYGLLYAAAFLTLVWIVVLKSMPEESLSSMVPMLVFVDLSVIGFFFIAGQILFEKSERSLYALVVTPLTYREYLSAKLVSLTLMALVVSMIMTVFTYGWNFSIFWLLVGVSLMSVFALLLGLISVAPYSSISDFVIPGQIYMLLMNVPLFYLFGVSDSILFYLIPTQGAMLLIYHAFNPIETWELIYGILYMLIWIGILIKVSQNSFQRYVVAERGGKI